MKQAVTHPSRKKYPLWIRRLSKNEQFPFLKLKSLILQSYGNLAYEYKSINYNKWHFNVTQHCHCHVTCDNERKCWTSADICFTWSPPGANISSLRIITTTKQHEHMFRRWRWSETESRTAGSSWSPQALQAGGWSWDGFKKKAVWGFDLVSIQ